MAMGMTPPKVRSRLAETTAPLSESKPQDQVLPPNFPEKLKGADPRIIALLCKKPNLLELLNKNPSIYDNFTPEKLAQLADQVRSEQQSQLSESSSGVIAGGH